MSSHTAATNPTIQRVRRRSAFPLVAVVALVATMVLPLGNRAVAATPKTTVKRAKTSTKKTVTKKTVTKKRAAPTTTSAGATFQLLPVTTLAAPVVPTTVAPAPAATTSAPPTLAPTTTVASDFEIRVAQPNQTIGRNETATYTLFVDAGSGYGGSVILAISDLPPGTEAVYEPVPIATVGQVRIRTSDRTPNGTFAVKAIASTPRSSRNVTLILIVVDGNTSTTSSTSPTSTSTTSSSTTTTIGTKTFALQTNQVGNEIAPGKTIRVDVQIIPSGGFNEPIVLSVAGTPQGTSASFVKTPISIAETGQLFISAAANANNLVAGTVTVTISAVGGGVTRTASISFTVKTAP